MAWITPITNWIASNILTKDDMNRIEGNTLDLYTNKEDKSVVSTLATLVGTKVDKITGKGLSESDYTTVEKTKLSGIATNAQVNAVTTVAGRTGAVVVAKADVGLGSVENYAKASQAEAEAGTSDIKYMTPLRTKQAMSNISIKTGMIGNDGIIPQTAGYTNYMYLVSIRFISNPSLTTVGCDVTQATRVVRIFGGTGSDIANWYEIAW